MKIKFFDSKLMNLKSGEVMEHVGKHLQAAAALAKTKGALVDIRITVHEKRGE